VISIGKGQPVPKCFTNLVSSATIMTCFDACCVIFSRKTLPLPPLFRHNFVSISSVPSITTSIGIFGAVDSVATGIPFDMHCFLINSLVGITVMPYKSPVASN